MEPISIGWRISLAGSAIAIGSISVRALFVAKGRGECWLFAPWSALMCAVYIGYATLLALTAAIGRFPWAN